MSNMKTYNNLEHYSLKKTKNQLKQTIKNIEYMFFSFINCTSLKNTNKMVTFQTLIKHTNVNTKLHLLMTTAYELLG